MQKKCVGLLGELFLLSFPSSPSCKKHNPQFSSNKGRKLFLYWKRKVVSILDCFYFFFLRAQSSISWSCGLFARHPEPASRSSFSFSHRPDPERAVLEKVMLAINNSGPRSFRDSDPGHGLVGFLQDEEVRARHLMRETLSKEDFFLLSFGGFLLHYFLMSRSFLLRTKLQPPFAGLQLLKEEEESTLVPLHFQREQNRLRNDLQEHIERGSPHSPSLFCGCVFHLSFSSQVLSSFFSLRLAVAGANALRKQAKESSRSSSEAAGSSATGRESVQSSPLQRATSLALFDMLPGSKEPEKVTAETGVVSSTGVRVPFVRGMSKTMGKSPPWIAGGAGVHCCNNKASRPEWCGGG